jgi:hypothetical protein
MENINQQIIKTIIFISLLFSCNNRKVLTALDIQKKSKLDSSYAKLNNYALNLNSFREKMAIPLLKENSLLQGSTPEYLIFKMNGGKDGKPSYLSKAIDFFNDTLRREFNTFTGPSNELLESVCSRDSFGTYRVFCNFTDSTLGYRRISVVEFDSIIKLWNVKF